MPSLPMHEPITLSGARRLAANCNKKWVEIKHDKIIRVVSFTRNDEQVDVHYSSETVATTLDHPKRGRNKLFRDNVNLATLKQIFDYPRIHTVLGYRNQKDKEKFTEKRLSNCTPQEREVKLKKELHKIDKEIKRLQQSRTTIAGMVRKVQEQHEQKEAKRKRALEVEIENRRKAQRKDFQERGRKLTCHFSSKAVDFLDAIDLKNAICIVALPRNRSVLYTTRTGEFSWSGRGVPEIVKNTLKSHASEQNRPTAVAIGTHGRYFLQFSNGLSMIDGGDDFDNTLTEEKEVKMVAFGKYSSSYFVLYNNGACEYNNVPIGLMEYLNSRGKHQTKVEFASLGEGGQYFVRLSDGSWDAGGLTDPEDDLLEETEEDGEIREIVFGFGGIIIRYN